MITKSRRLRKTRIRAKVSGSAERPRLSVFRSNKKIYVQLIDDVKGKTLAAASGTDAKAVGEAIAKAAVSKKITKAVFDRGGYQYHGRVKILAETAREKGLTI